MTANHRRDLLDIIDKLRRDVVDLQASRTVGARPFPCTSTTHPSAPSPGQPIFETDTGLTAYWNGSGWVYQVQLVKRRVVSGSAVSSVSLDSLPAVFTSLRLEWWAHLTSGGPTDLLMQVDGNTGANYTWAKMEAASATQSNFHGNAAATTTKIGAIGGTTSGYFASGTITIAGWNNSTGYVSTSGTSTLFDSNTADYVGAYGGQLVVAAPHSSLQIAPASGQLAVGSQFSVYGMT